MRNPFSGLPPEASNAPSSPFRRSLKMPVGKPPLLKSVNHLHAKPDSPTDVFLDNSEEQSEVKFRFKKPLPLDLKQAKLEYQSPDIPETHLEVNVKMKGKKMSWEKRFVKVNSSMRF